MKQTVQTKNYNATIEIPYSKLLSKSNCIKLPQECSTLAKTIVIPQCNHNNIIADKDSGVTMEMLEELERAFQVDMQSKNKELKELRGVIMGYESQQIENRKQIQEIKKRLRQEQNRNGQLLKQKQEQIMKLVGQMKALGLQKERMLQIKIVQFQNSQIEGHKRQQNNKIEQHRKQQQKYFISKQKQEAQFNAKLANMQFNNQQQITKLNEQNLRLQLSSQFQIKSLNKEKQSLEEQLSNEKHLNNELNKQIRQFVAKQREYLVTISERDSALRDKNNEIQDIQKEINIQRKGYEDSRNVRENLEIKLNEYLFSNQQLNKNYSQVCDSRRNLQDRLREQENQRELSMRKIEGLYLQIDKMKQIIKEREAQVVESDLRYKSMQNPKVYEVKIEKVIDRQDYIIVLEKQIEVERRKVISVEDKIKELEKVIEQRNYDIQNSKNMVIDLQNTIASLKLYIEQKEKSFAWIVQREITRDIKINQGEFNKTYKVYPMEVQVSKVQQKVKVPQSMLRVGEKQKIIIRESENLRLVQRVESYGEHEQVIEDNLDEIEDNQI